VAEHVDSPALVQFPRKPLCCVLAMKVNNSTVSSPEPRVEVPLCSVLVPI
jgi:hypothetical protein